MNQQNKRSEKNNPGVLIIRLVFAILILGIFLSSVFAEEIENMKANFPFYIYRTYGDSDNFHYYLSGLLGDTYTLRIAGNHRRYPYTGTSCIEIIADFSNPYKLNHGWVSINWLEPANNWGQLSIPAYDLRGAGKLVFYARGKTGEEYIRFKVGGVKATYGDSGGSQTLKVTLTKTWQRYEIYVDHLNLSRIICAFSCTITVKENPDGATLYLDNIYFEE